MTIVPSTAIASRAAALDAILPFDRRGQLAALLTDDDPATLKHSPVRAWAKICSRSSPRSTAIEAWCRLATGAPSPGPAPESLPPKFVAHLAGGLGPKLRDCV